MLFGSIKLRISSAGGLPLGSTQPGTPPQKSQSDIRAINSKASSEAGSGMLFSQEPLEFHPEKSEIYFKKVVIDYTQKL
jgi:hypothetical protein